MKQKLYQVFVTIEDDRGHLILTVVYYDVATSKENVRKDALANMGRLVKAMYGYDAQVRMQDIYIVSNVCAHDGVFTWVHPDVSFYLKEMKQ